MNSKEIQTLTKKLATNPNLLREVEEETMRDLLLDYTVGLLDPNVEQEVRELIVSDPVAAAIWKNFNEIDTHLRSPEGQQWTEEAGERILSNVLREGSREGKTQIGRVTAQSMPAPAFFDRLSEWMASLFLSLSRQDAFSEKTDGSVVHKFASGPYRAHLERDAAGQWRLLVFTSDADAAKLKVRVEIEPEAPVVSFVAGEPGHFLAEVLVTEKMAQELKSGRPVFHPVE
jgi:hypothetical protein